MSEAEKDAKIVESAAVGAVVGLATLVMMFAGLLFAYAFLRVSAGGVWPPPAEGKLPRLWPLLASVIVLLGGIAIWRRPRHLRGVAVATCGAVVLCQGLTLVQAYRGGVHPSSGPFGSVFFALTGLHASHLAALGLLMAWQWWRSRRGGAQLHPAWGWATQVLGVLWLVIYASVYVF